MKYLLRRNLTREHRRARENTSENDRRLKHGFCSGAPLRGSLRCFWLTDLGFRILGLGKTQILVLSRFSGMLCFLKGSTMANDKGKTKAQLISELEEMRQENAALRRLAKESDVSAL